MKLHKTTLEDLSAVIGFTATVRLSAWFGDGTQNLYVPQVMEKGQLLVKLIGEPAARRMVEEWPGEHIAVPIMRDYEDDMRKRFIARLFERGFGSREIAGRLRISEKRVLQICRELEGAGLIDIVVPKKSQEKIGGKFHGKTPGEMPGKTAAKKKGA